MTYHTNIVDFFKIDTKMCRTLVETGSHRGHGAVVWASLFENVFTIELSKDLYDYCKQTHVNSNITFIHGASTQVLENLVSKIDHEYVLFLDAHGSGGDTTFDPVVGRFGSPVLQEIECVKNNPPKHIIIDDYLDFVDLPDYPKIHKIYEKLLTIGKYTSPYIHKNEFVLKGVIYFERIDQ